MTSTTNEPTNGIIEVDDNESGYGTSATRESETTSLSSSLEEWLMENGALTLHVASHLTITRNRFIKPRTRAQANMHAQGVAIMPTMDLIKT